MGTHPIGAPSRLVAASVLVMLFVLLVMASAAAAPPQQPTPQGNATIADARAFEKKENLQAYWLSVKFQDLPLTAIVRRISVGLPTQPRLDYVSFIYGDCEITNDSGCAPPLEIQNWSICL